MVAEAFLFGSLSHHSVFPLRFDVVGDEVGEGKLVARELSGLEQQLSAFAVAIDVVKLQGWFFPFLDRDLGLSGKGYVEVRIGTWCLLIIDVNGDLASLAVIPNTPGLHHQMIEFRREVELAGGDAGVAHLGKVLLVPQGHPERGRGVGESFEVELGQVSRKGFVLELGCTDIGALPGLGIRGLSVGGMTATDGAQQQKTENMTHLRLLSCYVNMNEQVDH